MTHKLAYLCSENWDLMKDAPQGKFCEKCHKTLIDLDKNPAPNESEFCGKWIEYNHKNQTISYTRLLQNQFFKRVGLFIVALLLFRKLDAQDSLQSKKASQRSPNDSTKNAQKGMNIEGTVTDLETKDQMPFVNVLVCDDKDNKIGACQTDFDGKFSIKVNIDSISTKTYSVKVSFIGYQTVKVIKVPKDKYELNIKLSSKGIKCDRYVGILIDYPKMIDDFNSGSKYTRKDILSR